MSSGWTSVMGPKLRPRHGLGLMLRQTMAMALWFWLWEPSEELLALFEDLLEAIDIALWHGREELLVPPEGQGVGLGEADEGLELLVV